MTMAPRSLPLLGILTLISLCAWNHATAQGGPDAGALLAAVDRNDLQQVKTALQGGADINGRGVNGTTALLAAARRNNAPIARFLLEQGADYTIPGSDGLNAFLTACAFGQDAVIKVFIERKVDVNAVTEQGAFALLLSSCGDYASTTRLLLENGAKVNLQNDNGMTALLIASQKNCLDAAAVLLDHGADPDLGNNEGWTPLMLAAQFGHRALVTNLVQRGVDFSRENENDMTAIFVAIEADQLSLARSFIEHGATPVEKEAYPYLTAMNYYLTAKYGGELAAGPNLEDFYRSASRLFGMAGTNCEEVIKGKGRQKAGKHALSALYIGGSAVLLATVGGAPIPFIESTNRQKDIIKANAERLKRCDQLKAQCEEIVACLGNGSDTGRPASCMRDDLTLSFGK